MAYQSLHGIKPNPQDHTDPGQVAFARNTRLFKLFTILGLLAAVATAAALSFD